MVWVEMDLKDYLVPNPLPRAWYLHDQRCRDMEVALKPSICHGNVFRIV